jgi:hypothetical protein
MASFAGRDLARLYGVETRRLNERVRRNKQRFPADFIFEVSNEEARALMSQFATSTRGGTRKRPLAFTEHGAIMAATVLNSPNALKMSVFVVRAFVQYTLASLLTAIRSLTESPASKKRPIGFTADLSENGGALGRLGGVARGGRGVDSRVPADSSPNTANFGLERSVANR